MKLDKLNQALGKYNKAAVAREMGITRSSLCKKLKGVSKISLAEAAKLKGILRLTDDETKDIFFED